MIHYTCDRCANLIDPELEVRYVVRIEIQASVDFPGSGADEEEDNLLELSEILQRLEDAEMDEIGDDVYQRRKFDLCPKCYREYVQNPLSQESQLHVGFSDN
jgi:hypothetical protein